MCQTILKIITHPDGKRRVVLFTNEQGRFTFEEQRFADDPMEMSWIPCGKTAVSICDSIHTAEQEARGRIEWLAQPSG